MTEWEREATSRWDASDYDPIVSGKRGIHAADGVEFGRADAMLRRAQQERQETRRAMVTSARRRTTRLPLPRGVPRMMAPVCLRSI